MVGEGVSELRYRVKILKLAAGLFGIFSMQGPGLEVLPKGMGGIIRESGIRQVV